MSLLDELRSILHHHHAHVLTQVNQGTARLIEAHLTQLDTVAADAEKADEAAHKVLGELYGALNAPAAVPTAPVSDVPAPTVPVIVGEPGPELAALPEAVAPVEHPFFSAEPASDAVVEATDDEPQATEGAAP